MHAHTRDSSAAALSTPNRSTRYCWSALPRTSCTWQPASLLLPWMICSTALEQGSMPLPAAAPANAVACCGAPPPCQPPAAGAPPMAMPPAAAPPMPCNATQAAEIVQRKNGRQQHQRQVGGDAFPLHHHHGLYTRHTNNISVRGYMIAATLRTMSSCWQQTWDAQGCCRAGVL